MGAPLQLLGRLGSPLVGGLLVDLGRGAASVGLITNAVVEGVEPGSEVGPEETRGGLLGLRSNALGEDLEVVTTECPTGCGPAGHPDVHRLLGPLVGGHALLPVVEELGCEDLVVISAGKSCSLGGCPGSLRRSGDSLPGGEVGLHGLDALLSHLGSGARIHRIEDAGQLLVLGETRAQADVQAAALGTDETGGGHGGYAKYGAGRGVNFGKPLGDQEAATRLVAAC